MDIETAPTNGGSVSLRLIGKDNWHAVADLKVAEEQRAFVAETSFYLALCCYSDVGWQPLAIYAGERLIGFLMWAVDPADGSCWLGGIVIDRGYQGRGYGRQAIQAALARLRAEHGHRQFALSYQPANSLAKHLYSKLGFVETGEEEGDEVVARLSLAD